MNTFGNRVSAMPRRSPTPSASNSRRDEGTGFTRSESSLKADPALRIAGTMPPATRHAGSLAARVFSAFLALVAVGCSTGATVERLSPEPRQLPRPEPTAVRIVHDVRFPRGAAIIQPAEAQALDRFLLQHGVSRNDELVVSTGFADGIAGTDSARREAIARFLESRHFRVLAIPDGFDGEPGGQDVVQVIVHRTLVTLPACPDWSGPTKDTGQNIPFSNFGCADAVNLGLMVARPSDLGRGRDLGTLDGQVGAAAVERYRLGKTKPLDDGSSTSRSGSSGDQSGSGQ